MLKLYSNIKEYRILNNWSQEDLARKVGYKDRTIISKIESGSVDLSQSKIAEFAKVFGITPGKLMGNDGCDQGLPLPSDSIEKLSFLDEWGVRAVVETIDHEFDRCVAQDRKKEKDIL